MSGARTPRPAETRAVSSGRVGRPGGRPEPCRLDRLDSVGAECDLGSREGGEPFPDDLVGSFGEESAKPFPSGRCSWPPSLRAFAFSPALALDLGELSAELVAEPVAEPFAFLAASLDWRERRRRRLSCCPSSCCFRCCSSRNCCT